jgi:predicted dienelactone hydrolase
MSWRYGVGVVLLTAVAASEALVAQDDLGTRYRAGYEALRITDPARTRPIQLDVWYPAETDETTHRYGLFSTGRVAPGAPMAAGRFPVILLSHGALGAATNYSWIAERLARSAFVVVGVSHFGESRVFGESTVNSATVADFGSRTRDFSFALDFVLQRSKWASGADGGRVGAIGHSSGGATVAMLAGGQYRPEGMAAFCLSKEGSTDRGCGYRAGASTQTVTAAPARDSRLRAVVLLDPAVGPGFDRPGLERVRIPALVIGSVANDFMPFALNGGRYAGFLPNAEVIRLDRGEGHFVYLDECSAPIEAMGLSLCSDRPGVIRGDVHQRLGASVVDFLTRQLVPQAGPPKP